MTHQVADTASNAVRKMVMRVFTVSTGGDKGVELFERRKFHGDEAALFEADGKKHAAGIEQIGQRGLGADPCVFDRLAGRERLVMDLAGLGTRLGGGVGGLGG